MWDVGVMWDVRCMSTCGMMWDVRVMWDVRCMSIGVCPYVMWDVRCMSIGVDAGYLISLEYLRWPRKYSPGAIQRQTDLIVLTTECVPGINVQWLQWGVTFSQVVRLINVQDLQRKAFSQEVRLLAVSGINVHAGMWARGGWSGSDAEEKRIKEETQATLRCYPFEQPAGPHKCFMTGQPAAEVAIFAKSY